MMLVTKNAPDVVGLHYLWVARCGKAKRGRNCCVMLAHPQGAYQLTRETTLKEARRYMRSAAKRAENDALLLKRQALEIAKVIEPLGYA